MPQKNLTNTIFYNVLIFSFIILFILILDLIYSNFFYQKSFKDLLQTNHSVYHHGFNKNVKVKGVWDGRTFDICTDSFGSKRSCDNKEKTKNFDIAFIGDSFTEGVGQSYENSFVGIIDKKTKLKITNLGVSTYSPVIYYHKIKFLLDRGMTFKHLILFMDLTDIPDELIWKNCGDYVCENLTLGSNPFLISIKKNLKNNFKFLYGQYYKIKSKYSARPDNFNIQNVGPLNFEYPRSSWPYNPNHPIYEDQNSEKAIKLALNHTQMLFDLLQEKNISLSIAVYPHPSNILFGSINSKQVKIWENFCLNKCYEFIDYYKLFFNLKDNLTSEQIVKKYYYKNDNHFNYLGNKIVGENFPIKNFN